MIYLTIESTIWGNNPIIWFVISNIAYVSYSIVDQQKDAAVKWPNKNASSSWLSSAHGKELSAIWVWVTIPDQE